MNLVPNTTYTLIRQLANPTDTQTYYVQAVVRNIITGKTIKTINLVNQGGQRFTAPYQVPADTSGQGTYISICTYVFDDAGYSVPDGNYETEDKEYLIIQPPVSTYGNGGTTIVDYDKIKKYISDIKFPGIPTYDKEFRNIKEYHEGRFKELGDRIGKIDFPKYDDKDLRKEITVIRREMQSMAVEHSKNLSDMGEIHNKRIAELKEHFNSVIKSSNSSVEKALKSNTESADNFTGTHAKKMDEINENYKKLYNLFAGFVGSAPLEKPKEEKQDSSMIRARKLLGI